MDLNLLELGLTALEGNYMTQALNDWFIYLAVLSSSLASFTACYFKTTEIVGVSADMSLCEKYQNKHRIKSENNIREGSAKWVCGADWTRLLSLTGLFAFCRLGEKSWIAVRCVLEDKPVESMQEEESQREINEHKQEQSVKWILNAQ